MKYTILFIILLFPGLALAKPTIVSSVTPIASLVAILTRDSATVTALDVAGGCPHHHHAKPSDKSTIENAQMVIYIDDDFDGLVVSLLADYKGQKVKISDFTSLDFHGKDGKINWHFWLDLNNVRVLQDELARVLIATFPEMKNVVEKNLSDSIVKINELAKIKQSLKLGSTALLSDSLEHFFKSIENDQFRVFQVANTSLKNMQKLDELLGSNLVKCIVLAGDQNASSYSKYNKIIVQLDSENWVVPENANNVADLFINEYSKMIEQAKKCTVSSPF